MKEESKQRASVGTGKAPFHKSRWLAALAVILVAAAVGGGVAWWRHERAKNYVPVSDPLLARDIDKAQSQALLKGDTAAAEATLQKAIKNTTDVSKKRDLYVQLGITYENQSKYDQALAAYRQAEALGITYNVALRIAQTAQAAGQKDVAITYYKKAISLLDPKNPMRDDDKLSFEAAIRSLGGQP